MPYIDLRSMIPLYEFENCPACGREIKELSRESSGDCCDFYTFECNCGKTVKLDVIHYVSGYMID